MSASAKKTTWDGGVDPRISTSFHFQSGINLTGSSASRVTLYDLFKKYRNHRRKLDKRRKQPSFIAHRRKRCDCWRVTVWNHAKRNPERSVHCWKLLKFWISRYNKNFGSQSRIDRGHVAWTTSAAGHGLANRKQAFWKQAFWKQAPNPRQPLANLVSASPQVSWRPYYGLYKPNANGPRQHHELFYRGKNTSNEVKFATTPKRRNSKRQSPTTSSRLDKLYRSEISLDISGRD